ncbi:hypothetical protein LEP1GSC040_3138 [Leptospira santarosai str. 2000030832]|nr:hypothetical protein LEP1GSC040_3138 [Leptospira santarosai str. 2000030832]
MYEFLHSQILKSGCGSSYIAGQNLDLCDGEYPALILGIKIRILKKTTENRQLHRISENLRFH